MRGNATKTVLKKAVCLFSAFCMIMTVFPAITVWAAGTCGENANYTLSDTKLTITGSGAMDGTAPWSVDSSTITEVIIQEGITEIPAGTFSGISNLAKADIAESVETIEDGAFPSYQFDMYGWINHASGRYAENDDNVTLKMKKMRILCMGNSHTNDYNWWMKNILKDLDANNALTTEFEVKLLFPYGGRHLYTDVKGDGRGTHYGYKITDQASQYEDAFSKTWDLVIIQDYHESTLIDDRYTSDQFAADMQEVIKWLNIDVPGADIAWFADWVEKAVNGPDKLGDGYTKSIEAINAVEALTENKPDFIINGSTILANARTTYLDKTKNHPDALLNWDYINKDTEKDVYNRNDFAAGKLDEYSLLERDNTHMSLELGRQLMATAVLHKIFNQYNNNIVKEDGFDFFGSITTAPEFVRKTIAPDGTQNPDCIWQGSFIPQYWDIIRDVCENTASTPLAVTNMSGEYGTDPFVAKETALKNIIENVEYTEGDLESSFKNAALIAEINEATGFELTADDIKLEPDTNDNINVVVDYNYGYSYPETNVVRTIGVPNYKNAFEDGHDWTLGNKGDSDLYKLTTADALAGKAADDTALQFSAEGTYTLKSGAFFNKVFDTPLVGNTRIDFDLYVSGVTYGDNDALLDYRFGVYPYLANDTVNATKKDAYKDPTYFAFRPTYGNGSIRSIKNNGDWVTDGNKYDEVNFPGKWHKVSIIITFSNGIPTYTYYIDGASVESGITLDESKTAGYVFNGLAGINFSFDCSRAIENKPLNAVFAIDNVQAYLIGSASDAEAVAVPKSGDWSVNNANIITVLGNHKATDLQSAFGEGHIVEVTTSDAVNTGNIKTGDCIKVKNESKKVSEYFYATVDNSVDVKEDQTFENASDILKLCTVDEKSWYYTNNKGWSFGTLDADNNGDLNATTPNDNYSIALKKGVGAKASDDTALVVATINADKYNDKNYTARNRLTYGNPTAFSKYTGNVYTEFDMYIGDNAPAHNVIYELNYEDGTIHTFFIAIGANGRMTFNPNTETPVEIFPQGTFGVNKWHSFKIKVDAVNEKMYIAVDGKQTTQELNLKREGKTYAGIQRIFMEQRFEGMKVADGKVPNGIMAIDNFRLYSGANLSALSLNSGDENVIVDNEAAVIYKKNDADVYAALGQSVVDGVVTLNNGGYNKAYTVIDMADNSAVFYEPILNEIPGDSKNAMLTVKAYTPSLGDDAKLVLAKYGDTLTSAEIIGKESYSNNIISYEKKVPKTDKYKAFLFESLKSIKPLAIYKGIN